VIQRKRDTKPNPTEGFAYPKPTRKAKAPKRREPHAPLRIKKNEKYAGYLAWIHEQRCVVTGLEGSAFDPIEASHVGRPGTGMKAGNDFHTVPMLRSVHRQWGSVRTTGRFKDMTLEQRRVLSRNYLVQTHATWHALPIETREWYQTTALAVRESMRGGRRR